MREILALTRAQWLSQTSYRLQTLLSFAGIIVSVIPLYFVSDALQPVMENAIRNEGGQYFGFLVIGMVATLLLNASVLLMPSMMASSISRGTLEAMLSTPASVPTILIGMIGAGIVWAFARIVVLLAGGWVLGAPVQWDALVPLMIILGLIMLSYLPFGIIAAALVLTFRTSGPLPQGVTYLSILLGGVYYPTHVIPSWLESLSDFVPLTYGLRALRRVALDGENIGSVLPDLLIVGAFIVILTTIASTCFAIAFRHARRAGTIAQY